MQVPYDARHSADPIWRSCTFIASMVGSRPSTKQIAPIRQNEDGVFCKTRAGLVRDILMQVWRISQSHPRSASIIFGIKPK